MLVLARRLGEKVFINTDPSDPTVGVTITVVDIDRGKVRLGFEAPRKVPIYRAELLPLRSENPSPPLPPVSAN